MRYTLLLLLAAAIAVPASAQTACTAGSDFTSVTLDQVNAIPQAQLDILNGAGADLTTDQIEENVRSAFAGELIEFSAVVLTDPLLSGLASANEGIPGRIHVFVRDTAADTAGPEGMNIQIVDNRGDGSIQSYEIGDEITVCGTVTYFGSTVQLAPTAIVLDDSRGSDDPILDPITITPDVIHDAFEVGGETLSQIDWNAYPDYVNQYVRFEAIDLLQGLPGDRPNLLFSQSGEDVTIRSYDTSVCFRNDRAESYFPANQEPACNEDDFVPPPSGIVNVQGFLTIAGVFDAFGTTSVPGGGAFSISPFAESDFEVAVAPPSIVLDDAGLPTPGATTITATVSPGTQGNTVASVTASYTTASGANGEIDLSNTSGDTYSGTIEGLSEGEFLTYTVTATDNQNAASTSSRTVLLLDGPVDSIFDVQRTSSGGEGASSVVTSEPIAFDLDAVVMAAGQFGDSPRYQAYIQDDADLGAFSGVLVDFGSATNSDNDPGLSPGDQITITMARVSEFNSVTQLSQVMYTTTGTGDLYDAKLVTTDLFNGAGAGESGEQFESMLLRFEGGTVTSANPDGDRNFGEFAFSTDGTPGNQLRVDDASANVPFETNAQVTEGDAVVSVEGFLSYAFGNYKLIPVSLAAINIGNVAVGTGPGESAVGIAGVFPNPATGAVRIRFELAVAGDVSLVVFDAMGRQVATVAEGAYSAAAHDVPVDLSELASGVYVVRLQAAGEVATSRLTVVR